ncbi:hypothetical protein PtA15_8A327 [Puccinia triticina]|uniref:Uncharacterized protein n=1 Tax=Puccinia triticina TaxID=208348 RepID=A0ABY7CR56_9BASI|nr:uncharacterized protein PtA15_8A327 [Puccinia triticina]WAQ87423.1 hypothetical protein PtA15_8A327 [Puccinia triticina]WAR57276.1 hypothetical protein PtB15_8B323 [Puccinia triticina]
MNAPIDRLRSLAIFFLAINLADCQLTTSDSFKESLTIRPLQDGKLHTLFKFELSTALPTRPLESPASSNLKLLQSDLLPISVLELADRFGIKQLSLSLSRGRWEYDRWSEPNPDHWQGYPRGSELAVWLNPQSNATELTNTLAGIFCGSLNRLTLLKDPPIALSNPTFSTPAHHQSFYHGLLPIEQPCTENLSPLFKLLPCGRHAGLASMIDTHKIFDGNWQSIRFKLFDHQSDSQPSATNQLDSNLRLEIEIETVLDQVRKTTKRDWDFKSIFGHPIEKKCPLSSSSIVEIVETKDAYETEALVRPTIHPRAHADGLPVDGKHQYDILKAILPLEVEMKWPSEEKFKYPEIYTPPPVKVKRILLGHGQTRGLMGIEIEMTQEEINKEQEIVYFEELPWWLTIYLHTLKVEVDDKPIKDPNQVMIKKVIKPSLQRQRPYSFAMTLKFPTPEGSRTRLLTRKMKILFEYEKDLLLYTEYFSDANRGFDLNPAALITRTSDQDTNKKFGNSSHSSSDGAMALFFGSVFNLLVRDFKLIKIKTT